MASVVIIFRYRRLRIQTDEPGFDEVTFPPVFHLRHESWWQRSRELSRGFNKLRSLQEEDVALIETTGCDQALLDLDYKLSQWIRILEPKDVMILPFDIQVVDKTGCVIQPKCAAASVG